jgi:hypothetical protein
MVVRAYNPSTQKAEAGRSQVRGQSGLHSETLSQKQNKTTTKVLSEEYKICQLYFNTLKVTFWIY